MAMRRPLRGEVRESSALAARRVSPHHLDRVGPPYQLRKRGGCVRSQPTLQPWSPAVGSRGRVTQHRRDAQTAPGRPQTRIRSPNANGTEKARRERTVRSHGEFDADCPARWVPSDTPWVGREVFGALPVLRCLGPKPGPPGLDLGCPFVSALLAAGALPLVVGVRSK